MKYGTAAPFQGGGRRTHRQAVRVGRGTATPPRRKKRKRHHPPEREGESSTTQRRRRRQTTPQKRRRRREKQHTRETEKAAPPKEIKAEMQHTRHRGYAGSQRTYSTTKDSVLSVTNSQSATYSSAVGAQTVRYPASANQSDSRARLVSLHFKSSS